MRIRPPQLTWKGEGPVQRTTALCKESSTSFRAKEEYVKGGQGQLQVGKKEEPTF